MNPNLDLMSMEELSRLARNEGEDITLRRQALNALDAREANTLKQLKPHNWGMGGVRRPRNYIPGL